MHATPAGPPPAAPERLAAENAELRERLAETERYTAQTLARATRLSQIVSVLAKGADLDQVVAHAAVTVAELFSADVALLLLGSRDRLEVAAHWGLRPRDVPTGPLALEHLDLLTPGHPVLAAPAAECALPAWLDRYRPRHAAWAQLYVGEESLGVMLIVRRADLPFERTDEDELKAVAYRLALAVENGLLHRRTAAQIAQLGRLYAVTAELAGTLDVTAAADRIAAALVDEAGAGASAVYLDGQEPLATSSGAQPTSDWVRLAIETADGRIGEVAVQDLPTEGSAERDGLRQLLGLAGLALEKAVLYERSREQARRDSLTGLLAHRTFHEELARLEADGGPFTLLVADIDDFKQVNDLYGHPVGDEALRCVARALQDVLRDGDGVYRTGGEEFSVLLPGLERAAAWPVAERLRASVARIVEPLPVTVSIGLAAMPEHAAGREELVERADAALYHSKRAGKNQVTVSGSGIGAPSPVGVPVVAVGADLRLLHDQDPETAVHSAHVANLAVATARALGLAADRLPALRTAAKLHDIGKIGVPRAILTKPGALDDEEFRIIKTHPVIGEELVRSSGEPEIARFVGEHHENVDGTGYPRGLRGEEIAVESRIIRVVDAYLAMTTDRPYRGALTAAEAAAELRRCAGTQFDADVVAALLHAEAIGAPTA